MEKLVRSGTESKTMSPDETVVIIETLDEIRAQIGLVYPQEG